MFINVNGGNTCINLNRRITKFLGLTLFLTPMAYGGSTVVSKIGNFDYVSGSMAIQEQELKLVIFTIIMIT